MSMPPDRPNSGGANRSYGGGANPIYSGGNTPQAIKDFAYGIWIPACIIATAISALSAPHALGLMAVKVFILFALCAIAILGIFLNLQRRNNTWIARLNHWAVFTLVVHTLYFSFIHSVVAK